MIRPRAAVSWSGGKDCCLAFLRARDTFDPVALITMFGEDGNRSRSHGLTPVMPLWGQPTQLLAEEFIARGGEARFVTVRPPLLDESWLGLTLDAVALQRLQAIGADPCGEFGEYHTVVTGCPAFSSPLTLEPGQLVLSGGCWALDFDVSS